ncbi:MAG: ATP-binding protein [Actinobacteria bacterium]|nr:ATP-binding protein [Actinomycetota bacterium]
MPDEYLPRVVDIELDELLPALPALALEGAKGVGKTVTARRRARTVHALDAPGARELFEADPRRLVDGEPPVLLDEWQRIPASWDLVRRAVDDDASPGRFLLTGSASPAAGGTHSGAGRIIRLRMRPLTLAERGVGESTVSLRELLSGRRPALDGSTDVGLERYAEEICRSGFPGLRGLSERALYAQLDGYLERVIDRDLKEVGQAVRTAGALRRWMTAYGAATATTAAYDVIRDAATPGERDKPAKATAQGYREALERLWILDPLPAWLPTLGHLRRLGSAPRHHLADPALAARLLGMDAGALLETGAVGPVTPRDGTLLGQLFESLVALDLRVYAQAAEARVGHLRTHGGEHEVDLIVERGDHRVLAIEVKLARTVGDDDLRHLHWLRHQLGDRVLDAIVVTTGPDAYRRPDGIGVVPAALLGP